MMIGNGVPGRDQVVTEFYPEMANVKHVLIRHRLDHHVTLYPAMVSGQGTISLDSIQA